MVVAGNETTTKLLGNALVLGVAQPRPAGAGLRRPDAGIPPWVEETLRYDTSSQMLARTVTGDVELHGTTIPAGDRVCCWSARPTATSGSSPTPTATTSAATRAPSCCSFGSGRHFCLGAPLARLEARVALDELVRRVRGYEIDEADAVPRPLGQRPRLRRSADHAWRSADAPVRATSRAPPGDRHRRVVGHRRGDGRRARRARPPGRARRPARRQAARRSPTQIRADGGEAVALPLDLTDADSVEAFAAPGHGRARRDRGAGRPTPATCLRPAARDRARARSTRRCRSTWSARNRLVTAVVPGHGRAPARRHRLRRSDVALRRARTWAPTSPRRRRSRAMVTRPADGARGHRRARVDRAARARR